MLHQTIKNQIIDALRSKDQIRLDTLRGLNALFQNELLATNTGTTLLSDDKVTALIKRSVKQRKDSISQFEIGHRTDLANKERAELAILESFLTKGLSRQEIFVRATAIMAALSKEGKFDPKAGSLPAQIGKLTGLVVKDLAGKADGSEVKSVIEEILQNSSK